MQRFHRIPGNTQFYQQTKYCEAPRPICLTQLCDCTEYSEYLVLLLLQIRSSRRYTLQKAAY